MVAYLAQSGHETMPFTLYNLLIVDYYRLRTLPIVSFVRSLIGASDGPIADPRTHLEFTP